MSGRTKRGKDGDGAQAFFPSPRFVHRVRNLEVICFPFSSCPAGGERSCLNIITEKRAQHSLSLCFCEFDSFKFLKKVESCNIYLSVTGLSHLA